MVKIQIHPAKLLLHPSVFSSSNSPAEEKYPYTDIYFTLYVSTGCTLSATEREPKTKYTGDSVLLSCSCEDPNTKPEDLRWTHVESSGTEVSSESPRYKDRVQMFHKTTPSNLSLLISNLTEDDQGTYRCTVNNKTSADTRLIVKGEAVVLTSLRLAVSVKHGFVRVS